MSETNEGDISSKISFKSKRKSVAFKVDKNPVDSTKFNIKSRRKSLMNKKLLMQLEKNKNENNNNISNNDESNVKAKRKSVYINNVNDLKLNLNDNDIKTANFKQNKQRRKSHMLRPIFELNNYVTLKAQLVDIPELIIQQESDIIEAVIGCQQPNNYHIYGRQKDGELIYLYKLREFSACAMRVFCPVNCRGFTMKMKLVPSYENKYDNNFTNSLMILEKSCKLPFLCLIRPDIKVNLVKDDIYLGTVEKAFSCCDPCFTVYNENGEEVKYIEADCCQCGFICRNSSLGKTDDAHFLIYNPGDRTKPIGDIVKKTESVFSLADSYSVVYPNTIPPEEKILLSIVAVLIDYQYFEKNNNVK